MKSIRRMIIFVVFALILSGCSLFSKKISMTDEEIQARITELDNGDYVFSPDEKYLKVDQESYAIYYNNLLNVYLHQALSGKEKEELASAVNGKLVSNVTGSVNYIQIMVPDFEMDELEQLRTKLYETGKVLFVNYETRSLQEETATFSGESVENGTWWKDAIDAERAWKYRPLLTDDTVVGIIDSGFDTENMVFQNNGKSKMHILGNNTPDDHGTSVAGLIAANNSDESNVIGVFSEANLLCVNRANIPKTSYLTYYINSMVGSKARVINQSYNWYFYDKEHYLQSDDVMKLSELLDCKPEEIVYDSYLMYCHERASSATQDCITILADLLVGNQDCLIVCAAGNGYNNGGSFGYDLSIGADSMFVNISPEEFEKWVKNSAYAQNEKFLHNITYDRLKEHIIVVSAASSTTNNQGIYELCKWSNYGALVDIAAPGEKIWCSIINNQESMGVGTSLSAPIVAGSAAYIWSLNPKMTGPEVKECLISTSQRAVGVTNEDVGRDYKMLNLGAAATSAVMGTVHFTVKDKRSGDTIEGVTCDFSSDLADDVLYSLPFETGNDGELSLPGIGTMHITLSKEGYETYTFEIQVSVKEDVEIGEVFLNNPSDQVLNKYRKACSYTMGEWSGVMDEFSDINTYAVSQMQAGNTSLFYQNYDIDHDGIEELIVAMHELSSPKEFTYEEYEICDIFAFNGLKPVRLFEDYGNIGYEYMLDGWYDGMTVFLMKNNGIFRSSMGDGWGYKLSGYSLTPMSDDELYGVVEDKLYLPESEWIPVIDDSVQRAQAEDPSEKALYEFVKKPTNYESSGYTATGYTFVTLDDYSDNVGVTGLRLVIEYKYNGSAYDSNTKAYRLFAYFPEDKAVYEDCDGFIATASDEGANPFYSEKWHALVVCQCLGEDSFEYLYYRSAAQDCCRPYFRIGNSHGIMLYSDESSEIKDISVEEYWDYQNEWVQTPIVFASFEQKKEPNVSNGNVYSDFLNNGKYQSYTSDWDFGGPERYALLDINVDGSDELLIASNGNESGVSDFVVFSYNTRSNSVELLPVNGRDSETFYDIYYQPKYDSLVYLEARPSRNEYWYCFDIVDGNRIKTSFEVGYEFAYEEGDVYYVGKPDDRKLLSKSEFDSYFKDKVELSWKRLP